MTSRGASPSGGSYLHLFPLRSRKPLVRDANHSHLQGLPSGGERPLRREGVFLGPLSPERLAYEDSRLSEWGEQGPRVAKPPSRASGVVSWLPRTRGRVLFCCFFVRTASCRGETRAEADGPPRWPTSTQDFLESISRSIFSASRSEREVSLGTSEGDGWERERGWIRSAS